jgi:hypothetical protein
MTKRIPARLRPGTRSNADEIGAWARHIEHAETLPEALAKLRAEAFPDCMVAEIIDEACAASRRDAAHYAELANACAERAAVLDSLTSPVAPSPIDIDAMLTGIDAELSGLCQRQRQLKEQRRGLVYTGDLPADHTRSERAAHAARMRWARR